MRYVAAYLLAVLGGNNNPSAKDIKNILGSVGIEADDERLNKVQINLFKSSSQYNWFFIQVFYNLCIKLQQN